MHGYTPEGAVLQESGLAKQSRHEQSSSHLLFPIMLNFATTDTAVCRAYEQRTKSFQTEDVEHMTVIT